MPDPNQDPKPNPPLDREAKRRLAVIRHVEEVTGNVATQIKVDRAILSHPLALDELDLVVKLANDASSSDGLP